MACALHALYVWHIALSTRPIQEPEHEVPTHLLEVLAGYEQVVLHCNESILVLHFPVI